MPKDIHRSSRATPALLPSSSVRFFPSTYEMDFDPPVDHTHTNQRVCTVRSQPNTKATPLLKHGTKHNLGCWQRAKGIKRLPHSVRKPHALDRAVFG